jgi:ATP-binding cassette subfamily B (MDR/TAP) protein 1
MADFLFCFTAARMARRIRLAYLKKVLHQPISYFDHNTPGSIATSLSTDTNCIEVGLADKMASVCQAIGMIIAALAIAFSKNWKMTLVVGTTIPYILITTVIIGSVDSYYETKQRKTYDEASKVAEEALSSVSSIKALGANEKIVSNFRIPVSEGSRVGLKIGPIQATMYGNMFFSIQSCYALALFYGVKLVSRGEIKNGGTVMTYVCLLLHLNHR